MAGQKFEYDENGGTFCYFVLSFLALILIPTTIYYWPRKKKEDPDQAKHQCQCKECVKKRVILAHSEPYKKLKTFLIQILIVLGWVLLCFVAYKVSQMEYEQASFDPYDILGIDPAASKAEIKKAYRSLSKIMHPDKSKDNSEEQFLKLAKAYEALTNPKSRENWEKYGNPDGPGAMSFGIALPSWIVEKENSILVLGVYALIFMVALPTVVGTWWYRSIRFSGDKVLLDTSQLYYYFFHKTPHMALKRVIMILAASLEFDPRQNSQVVVRQSDNEEVPALIRQLPNLNEKCKEQPLCRMYSIKTRAIFHAHLSRMSLNSETLEKDRQFIIKKCPYLIQEMVSCVHQLVMLAYARRVPRLPSIETIENCMKLAPMMIQGLWEFKNPLLQLPHLTDDHIHFMLKKKHVKNLQQLAQMKPEESKHLLKSLTDEEYSNVIKVLGKMPLIDFSIKCEVIDDENTNVVTAGAIVTVTVNLVRRNMDELFGDATIPEKQSIAESEEQPPEDGEEVPLTQPQKVVKKQPVWAKPNKKGKGKGKGKGSNQSNRKAKQPNQQTTANSGSNSVSQAGDTVLESKTSLDAKGSDAENDADSDIDEKESGSVSGDEVDEKKSSAADDDDEEWDRLQSKLNKREKLEGKSRISHDVHCPYFPEEKQEYWWTYICDRKSRTLLTSPYHITNLVDHEEVQLKFTAPRWPGQYNFTVCLRSDSYLGMDQQQELKLDVQKAPVIAEDHPQWDVTDSESDQQEEQIHDSEFTTDSSDDDEE